MERVRGVAVVGGGVIGLSIAWSLAKQRLAVTVFDARRIGSEASWAGAGMLAPGGEVEAPGQWSAFALESLRLYPDFVDELQSESGVSIDYRRCGSIDVAVTEDQARALELRAAFQQGLGILSEAVPPSNLGAVRAPISAARFYPGDAVVNPRDLTAALRVCCERAGVQFLENTPVHAISAVEPAECVILAAGAWTSQIVVECAGEKRTLPRSFPVRGHLISFDRAPHFSDSIIRCEHTYVFRRVAGAVIAGASTEEVGFDRTVDPQIAATLAADAARLVPALEGLAYEAWNGFRPQSETGEPVIGRLPDSNVWLAYGHYRNGILLAPATAARIATDVTRANLRRDWFSPAVHRQ